MNKPLVLVVEDDTPVRNLITTTLKTHEYRYLSAQNGASAVMEALSHNPDIVLLDLGLPDMDGVEIIRKIRSWSNIGALSFGGGYGMVSLVRETVLSNGWLTENEFLNFIAVSESTPGPLAVNMATFIGSTLGGILGSFVATLGVVLPSFLIILLIASALKNLMKYAPVNAFLSGVRPCVVAMILATALSMALSTLFGLTDLQAGFTPDLRSIAVFAMLGATHLICKKIRKTAPSPILMILFSAGLGILFWCIF